MRLAFGAWRLALCVRRLAFGAWRSHSCRLLTSDQSPLTCFRVPGATGGVGATGVIHGLPPTSQLLRAKAFLRPRSP
jgi:hypothetical protein